MAVKMKTREESEAILPLVTTARIKKFVDEYESRGFREQKAAAIAAGYAPKGAASAARKLLKEHPWVIEEIARRKEEAEARARRSASADLDEIIEILSGMIRVNFCDYLIKDGDRWRLRRVDELTETQQRNIKNIGGDGILLYDKMSAIRMLLNIYGKGNANTDEGAGVVVLPEIKEKNNA